MVGLPVQVFAAEDSLGWTYQFWRAAEKDAVNRAGGKIGAADLPAVTQLFTEPYMVKFLLHNTLGAWWAGKVLAGNPDLARDAADEQALRDACSHGLEGVAWEFLRFVKDGDGTGPWRPAAGTFPGWPRPTAEITFLDPCAGSGHFLVEAFGLLAALRRAEEGLSGEEAARAVLRDNLHGLEIDGRCVQIAAFNVALAAWRMAGGPVPLPQPQIAWVGAQPSPRVEMAALAGGCLPAAGT
ncbi:DNA methyltransferase [Siccirubricoccus deserti]